MNYKTQVKKGKELKKEIDNLTEVGDTIKVNYNNDDYVISCFSTKNYKDEPDISLSMSKRNYMLGSMNVSKVTNTRIHLYTFNMLSHQSKANLLLSDISLGYVTDEVRAEQEEVKEKMREARRGRQICSNSLTV